MLKVLDLFSGIGGFSLGLERTGGFETVAFCEIEKFPQKVLAKHWPEVPIYEDVRDVTAKQLRSDGIIPNVITGGFPCQDISVAGNQKGMGEGTRSGLWSECARLLGEIRPDYAIFENVTALLSGADGKWFERVLWDLSEVGYDAEWHCIPASELGAHHHRDRVWIIVYPNGKRLEECNVSSEPKGSDQFGRERDARHNVPNSESIRRVGKVAATEQSERPRQMHSLSSDAPPILEHAKRGIGEAKLQREKQPILRQTDSRWSATGSSVPNVPAGGFWAIKSELGRVANGIPNRSHRLKGLGNAVVPQIPELIGRAILEAENEAM